MIPPSSFQPSGETFPPVRPNDPDSQLRSSPCYPPPLFVATTHERSRGYVVEPPRGHRIIIGWQVTRTLSLGFNWPIIVARIDGAAGPDRRETFGGSLLTERYNATFCDEYLLVRGYRRDGGAETEIWGEENECEGKTGGEYEHRERKIEGIRIDVCEYYISYIHTGTLYVYVCVYTYDEQDRIEIKIGSTDGRKLVTAGLSDLPFERFTFIPFSLLYTLYHSIFYGIFFYVALRQLLCLSHTNQTTSQVTYRFGTIRNPA